MEIYLTTMSSKGQIVIPQELRNGIKEGDKLIVIKNKDQLILKKASELDKNFAEEITFAKRTEEAYKRYEKGQFKELKFNEFIEEIKKWQQ